jgi:hypothetical protein
MRIMRVQRTHQDRLGRGAALSRVKPALAFSLTTCFCHCISLCICIHLHFGSTPPPFCLSPHPPLFHSRFSQPQPQPCLPLTSPASLTPHVASGCPGLIGPSGLTPLLWLALWLCAGEHFGFGTGPHSLCLTSFPQSIQLRRLP